MSDPQYDGLCGIPLPHPQRGGTFIRCRLGLGHHGDHDWKKYVKYFYIQAYCPRRTWANVMRRLILMSPEEYERKRKRCSK